MRNFEQAMALVEDGDGFAATVTPDWAQGKAAFGGVVTGLGVSAICRKLNPARALRSVMVQFVAAVAPGPIHVEVTRLREGKAISQAQARLIQDGEVRAIVLAVLGTARASSMRVESPPPPTVPPPEQLAAFPFVEGVTPIFTRHFQYRWSSPAPLFSGSRIVRIGGWVRHAEPIPLDEAAVLALIDAWPAPVLTRMTRPAPASSVTWTVNLVESIAWRELAPDAWWRFECDTVVAAEGYVDIDGRLWDPAGRLVATSRQLVAEFS